MSEHAPDTLSKGGNVGLAAIWEEGKHFTKLSPSGLATQLGLQAFRSFLAAPFTALLTLVTIALALFLLAFFVMFFENVGDFIAVSQSEISVSLYLRDGASRETAQAIEKDLKTMQRLESVRYQDKREALATFRASLGDQAVLLDGLDEQNPLPASIELRFKRGEDIATDIRSIADKYEKHEAIEHIEYSEGLLERLSGMLRAFRWLGLGMVIGMLVLAGFIIGNTIQLALYAHREEIEIMYLVGATDGFVRAPYLVEGATQGVLGAALGILMLRGLYGLLQYTLGATEPFNMFFARIDFLTFSSVLLVLLAGLIAGTFGSYVALRRFGGA